MKSSQVNDSDSNSSVISLTITTLTVFYADVSKWILDMGAIYHVCHKREWFASFEKLNGGMVQMVDDHTCIMDGVGMVFIKIIDGIVWELKDVIYVFQIKKNILSVGAL